MSAEQPIPRLVPRDAATELFTMAHLITSTPHPLAHVDALAVMPGLGEQVRLTTTVRAWESTQQARYLLVSGTNPQEEHPTLDSLQRPPFNLERTEGVFTQVEAAHTRAQTIWISEQIQQLGITSLALFVSHWHMPRAYSTLIKNLTDDNIRIPVFPVAIPTPPNAIIMPETDADVVTMSAGEAVRIQQYQAIGHVATLSELQSYLTWLWEQDNVPIRNFSHEP